MTAQRGIAAVLALLAFASLVAQVRVNMIQDGYGLGESVFVLYRFFTIWTVTLSAIILAMVASGRQISPRIFGCIAMAIIVVGVVYHVLLAATHEVAGIEVFLNQVFHTILPIAVPIFWLVYEDGSELGFKDALIWICYPLFYCVAALLRAQFEGKYPYFFLNLDEQGVAGVAMYIVGLSIFILIIALLVVGAGRLASRK